MTLYRWMAKRDSDDKEIMLELDGTDGSVTIYDDDDEQPPVEPDRFMFPDDTEFIVLNGSTYKLAGVDPEAPIPPETSVYQGFRGVNQLVAYTTPGGRSEANQYGWELAVGPDMRVQATAQSGLVIPEGGFVLSGHVNAGTFLKTVNVGATVGLSSKAVEPEPGGVRTSNISLWLMMWSNSARVDIANIPDVVDELRLSFIVDDGYLVGWGPWGKAAFVKGIRAFLDKRPGRFISVAAGGGGYTINVSNPANYISKIVALEAVINAELKNQRLKEGFTFGGFNWDWENSAFRANQANVLDISRRLRNARGKGFYISWSPNGSFKNDYAVVAQQQPDLVDEIGFQNYDTPVNYNTSLDITRMLLGNKIPSTSAGSAMMIGSGSNYWTLQQCIDNIKKLRADAGVRKVALWEAGRSQTNEWANAMNGIVR